MNASQCDECCKSYGEKHRILVHIKFGHLQTDLAPRCDLCSETVAHYTWRRILVNHQWRMHSKQHSNLNSRPKELDSKAPLEARCDDCSSITACRTSIARHIKCHQIKFAGLRCDFCLKKHRTAAGAFRHFVSTHWGGAVEKFRCDCCCFTTACRRALSKHFSRNHQRLLTDEFRCDFCVTVRIYEKDLLMEHIRYCRVRKTQLKFRLFCDECGSSYSSKIAVTCHMRRVHSQRCFQCDDCASAQLNKENLLHHQRRLHLKINRGLFQCDNCEWFGQRISSIRNHVWNSHYFKLIPWFCP